MNREDIVRMAQEAGISQDHAQGMTLFLKDFAALVASAEREECAKLCWSQRKYWDAEACADAIRARGQA
jgi:hypothetical protein